MAETIPTTTGTEVLSVRPPLIRCERALGTDGRVHLLTALAPEHGWPRAWAWLPVRRQADRFEAIGAPFTEAFVRGAQDIGEPMRHTLPLAAFPAPADGEVRGLLCLFVHAHEQRLAIGAEPVRPLADVIADALAGNDAGLAVGLVLPPGPVDDALSFLLAACQYPPGVLDHSPEALEHPGRASPAEAALARLVAYCRRHPEGGQASLLVFAGDQIYADASSGLFDPDNQIDRYAKPYMQFKSGVVRHLPPSVERIVHVPDDHEIEDGWEPVAGAAEPLGPLYADARQAAWTHRWDPRPGPEAPERFWHAFDWRGAAFFIGDSRGEREPRRWDLWRGAQLISPAQRAALYAWLEASRGRPRFVVTSALLLPRRRATREHAASCLRSDAWDGYPASLHGLLAELWRQQAQDVVFLSGDEHRSGHVTARIEPADGSAPPLRLVSIHSSALYAPWPFAITETEHFAAPEQFEFDGPGGLRLCCTISAWHDHPGDGFALLRVREGRLQLWFDRAERPLHAAGAALPEADATFDLG